MLLIDEKEKIVTTEEEHSSVDTSKNQSSAKETEEVVSSNSKETKTKKDNEQKNNKKTINRPRVNKNDKTQVEFEDRIIDIARVTTVVKGGRRFSFSAVVAIGNKKGKVGIGHGKANEVPDAIKKAFKNAKNNLIEVPIINKSTIPHEVKAKYSASQILLKPAPKGKGIVASGTVRSVVELAGYTDIYTKSYGSRTKQNSAKVVIKALQQLRTAEKLASLRDVSVEHILKK